MRERKPVLFLLALRACTLINGACLKVITEILTQALGNNDQMFVYTAAGHGQQSKSSSAAFAEAEGAFTRPQHEQTSCCDTTGSVIASFQLTV